MMPTIPTRTVSKLITGQARPHAANPRVQESEASKQSKNVGHHHSTILCLAAWHSRLQLLDCHQRCALSKLSPLLDRHSRHRYTSTIEPVSLPNSLLLPAYKYIEKLTHDASPRVQQSTSKKLRHGMSKPILQLYHICFICT